MYCRTVLPVRLLLGITGVVGLSLISLNVVPRAACAQEPRRLRSLMYFGVRGLPMVDWWDAVLHNANAADSTNADQLWPGEGGPNRTGDGVTVGIWDSGPVRFTHQELTGRVSVLDGGLISDHATHVAGTIGATGVDAAARGMASSVLLYSRNSINDAAEMALDAGEIDISNHSYGYPRGWTDERDWGIGDVDTWLADYDATPALEDVNFGKYRATNDAVDDSLPWGNAFSDARGLDEVLYDNPNLLALFSGGNQRKDVFQNHRRDGTYVAYFSTSFPGEVGWHLVDKVDFPFPGGDGGATGYDTLANAQVAKNTLVVGSVLDHTTDPHDPATISTSSFSSYGPTDDGRVKPDVVANADWVHSSTGSGDAHYEYKSGTSMASPNAAGTAALLLEHYREVKSVTDVASATQKGLIIHTATDAGNPGPDYSYGYGLVNGAAAADFISKSESTQQHERDRNRIVEDAYAGVEQTVELAFDGSDRIKVTLVWTDPAPALGALPGPGLDDPTPVLVNDLDLWLTGPGGTYYPWTLDWNNPSADAVQTALNHVDNVEQVWIENPGPGPYTIHVGGTLDTPTYSSQDYSLLAIVSEANLWKLAAGDSYNESANWTNNRVPDGVNAGANFLGSITGPSTVTVNAPVTVGTINFDNANSYTIQGSSTVSLQASAGAALIDVDNGAHTISTQLSVSGGLTVDTAADTGLTIDTQTGYSVLQGTLTKEGSGSLTLDGNLIVVGAVDHNGGVLEAGAGVLANPGGDAHLAAGTTLKASGSVNRRVFGVPGDTGLGVVASSMEVTGPTDIGVLGESDGYAYEGALDVDSHMVGLRDADEAELYGAHMDGGTISSFNGIRLLPINTADGVNSRLYGDGVVNGNAVLGIEGNPTPALVVADPGGNIDFTGVVQTGNSVFVGNVTISGTERLGFSPKVGMRAGGAPIGPDAMVEIWGDVGADFESEIPNLL